MLPLGSTTDLVLSENYQTLYEFLQLRLCERVEWEIRELAQQVGTLLAEFKPIIFQGLGCRGDELGYFPEGHGACDKYKIKSKKKVS